MKRLLARIKRAPEVPAGDDAGFFSSVHQEQGDVPLALSSWRDRATLVGTTSFDREQGSEMFAKLWGADRHVVALSAEELQRMSQYLDFVRVPQGQELIKQDELGDYMLIVLEGVL